MKPAAIAKKVILGMLTSEDQKDRAHEIAESYANSELQTKRACEIIDAYFFELARLVIEEIKP